jgi:23S rRNA pseudouridine1911/1915/1917 synthase
LKYLRRTTIKIKSTYNVSQIESKYRFSNYCETHISVIPSKKGIKKAISKGELRLNGEKVEGGRWLKEGDIISFVDLEKTPPKEYHLKLDIIFEDEHLAVIFKPAGISVSGNLFKTIQNALLYNIKISKEPDALDWPLPVHRLDNQTSGLLLIAKTKLARVKLGQAFESKTILKKYQAVIIGKTNNSGEINTDVDDKSSQSHYKLIDSVPSLKNEFLSLIELEPKTGRTHQLRIHCASINHPILGDKLYGDEGMILKNKGLFLCATTISFNHPYSLQDLTFSTPTPHKFLKRMDNEKRRFLDFNKTEER